MNFPSTAPSVSSVSNVLESTTAVQSQRHPRSTPTLPHAGQYPQQSSLTNRCTIRSMKALHTRLTGLLTPHAPGYKHPRHCSNVRQLIASRATRIASSTILGLSKLCILFVCTAGNYRDTGNHMVIRTKRQGNDACTK